MKKKQNWLYGLIMVLLFPLFVRAESDFTVYDAFMVELFTSIHAAGFIILPISEYLKGKGQEVKFWGLFLMRVLVLLIITPLFPYICFVEVAAMFIVPIVLSGKGGNKNMSLANAFTVESPKGILKCSKCGREAAYGNKICPQCGAELKDAKYLCPTCHAENVSTAKYCRECGGVLMSGSDSVALNSVTCPKCKTPISDKVKFCKNCGANVEKLTATLDSRANVGTPIKRDAFDPIFFTGSESAIVHKMVVAEINKNPMIKGKTLPSIEFRKIILTLIYVVLTFVILTLYVAYHTYLGVDLLIFAILTGIFIYMTRKYSVASYIESEVKKRPDEKISYIASSILSDASASKAPTILIQIILFTALIVSSFLLYREPHLIYERQADGYHVRYYTFGLTKYDKTIVVPDKVHGKPVVGIRGDTFKNVYTVQKIVLPDTIKEIRGGAFQGCISLKEINLPTGITEIHGSTFEGDYSLERIEIPTGVTRIGGSAFRECSSLKEVIIPETVTEIGSSAFRGTDISSVCISKDAFVNERAFKETYASITYYEDGCKEPYYDDYSYNNDYFNNNSFGSDDNTLNTEEDSRDYDYVN